MEMKKAKIFKNVKTRWIHMLSPTKRVMVEYKTLLMKMAINNPSNEKAKVKFDLSDVQIMLGFFAILLLLNSIHNLMKIS
jgi:hypothetical protein